MPKGDHPYYYSGDKNFFQRIIDFGVPIGVFLLIFFFYNHGQITPSEMIKNTGLWAIALLGVTLLVGPLSRIIPALSFLKAHRKVWGILSVVIVLAHASLVTIYFYKFDFTKFIDFNSPKYPGLLSGILALVILLLVTFTSNQKALTSLSPGVWKAIQTTSYIAMILAIGHFYLMESTNGVLVIKRLLGRIIFGFAVFVIVARIIVLFLPSRKK